MKSKEIFPEEERLSVSPNPIVLNPDSFGYNLHMLTRYHNTLLAAEQEIEEKDGAIRGLLEYSAETTGAFSEIINSKDAEIQSLKEEIERLKKLPSHH